MLTLYIDTTYSVQVGLLSETMEWPEYVESSDAKSSVVVHALIQNLLDRQKCEINEVQRLIYVAGPGSYTGMRVSQGLAEILDWQKVEVFSFYHFQVPFLIGHNAGVWASNAFKNEYFIYEWNKEKNEKQILSQVAFTEKMKSFKDDQLYSADGNWGKKSTSALIKENAKILFPKIIDNEMREPLYYYRPLDQEFSKAKGS